MPNQFWNNVNLLIKQQNKTQASVSLECGFNQRRIQNLSSASRFPDADEAVKIAQALGTTVEYLVTGKQPQQDHRETQKLAAEILRLVSPYLGEQDL